MKLTDLAIQSAVIHTPAIAGYAPSNTTIVNYDDNIILQTRYVSYMKHFTSDIFNPHGFQCNQNYMFEKPYYDSKNVRYGNNMPFNEVIYPAGIDALFRGLEDPRFVIWDDELYTYGIRADKFNGMTCIVIYKEDGTEIVAKSPVDSSHEKNWMAIPDMPMHFVWGFKDNTMIICKVDNDGTCVITDTIPCNGFKLNDVRGNTALIKYNNAYITIVHKQFWEDNNYHYKHAILLFDSNLHIVNMSKWFIFNNPVCEFCTGLVIKDGLVYITYSELDCIPRILVMSLKDFIDVVYIDNFDEYVDVDEYIYLAKMMYEIGHQNSAKVISNFVLTLEYNPEMLSIYSDSLSIDKFLNIKYYDKYYHTNA